MPKINSKINTLVKNSTWLYCGKVTTQIFNVIVSVLVIKKLEVELYGTFTLLINTFFVFQIFGSGQISVLLNRYVPELYGNKQFTKLTKLVVYSLITAILILISLLALLFFLRRQYSDFFNVSNFNLYITPFFYYVFFYFLFNIFKSIITSLLLQKQATLIAIVQAICRLILYLHFLSELTISLLLLIEGSIAIVYIIGSVYVLYNFYRDLDLTPSPIQSRTVNKTRVIKFGLLGSLNELGSGVIGGTSDYFIISSIGNPYALGLYAFALRIKAMISNIFPLNEFTSVIRPLFFQKFTQNYDRNSFILIYNFMIKAIMPILLIPALYFLLFGNEVITYIFETEYQDAYVVTCIVLFGHLINGLFYPLGITIHLKERMEVALYSKVIVIFSIIAGIAGMRYFGIVGVAVASIVGNLLKNIFMIIMMKRFADIKYRLFEYKNYLVVIGILIGLFYFVNHLIKDVFSLLLWSFIFGLTALFFLILFHPYNPKDVLLLNKIADTSKTLKGAKFVITKVYHIKHYFTVRNFLR